MQMDRSWIISALACSMVLASSAAEAGGETIALSEQAPFVHLVVMKMKPGTPPAAIQQFITDGYQLLAGRPTVKTFMIGRPADPGSGDAETDYDVAMLVTYKDFRALSESLQHPDHVIYDERNLKWVESFRVYDFVDERGRNRP